MPPKTSRSSRAQPRVSSPASTSTASTSLPAAPLDISATLQNRANARANRRREKAEGSLALKQEANVFFKKGDFAKAIDKYEEANDKFGKTLDICCNLALVYRKLGLPERAVEAATDALKLDPKSTKARYRRGMARGDLGLWSSAIVDFETVLLADPTCTDAEKELQKAETQQLYNDLDSERSSSSGEDSEYEWPHYDRPPAASDVESDSSDCRHAGNGSPCRFYNHGGCARGETCRFSHAPDDKSLRDGLGRNVCLVYVLGLCTFENHKCVYAHDTQYLPKDSGWWNHDEQMKLLRKAFQDVPPDQRTKAMVYSVLSVKQNPSRPEPPAQEEGTHDFTLPPSEGLPYVLLLSLEQEKSMFERLHTSLRSALFKRSTVVHATTVEQALGCLTNCSKDLSGVLVTDCGIANRRFKNVLSLLAQYAKTGGHVVIGGDFCSHVTVTTMNAFWKEGWNLPFKMNSYHRDSFAPNRDHETVKANSSLPSTYNVKAVHLDNVPTSSALYGATGDSTSFLASRNNINEVPVVHHRFGQGYVGYIGDVNGEDASTTIVLAMLNLLDTKPNNVKGNAHPHISGSKTSPSFSTAAKPKIHIAIFQLSDRQSGLFNAVYGSLVDALKVHANVRVIRTEEQALDRFANLHELDGILVVDSEPVETTIAAFMAEYTRRGGVVVFGGLVPSVVDRKQLGPFFEKWWEVDWTVGTFRAVTPTLNSLHELNRQKIPLPAVAKMNALNLTNISPSSAVYRVQGAKNITESPVLRAQVGKGRLCWIGDVECGDSYSKIVLGLFDQSHLED